MQVDLSFIKNSNLTWLNDNLLLVVLSGSHAYGTNIETSDVDLRGIVCPPKEYFLSYLKKFEEANFSEPDAVLYNITKWFQLAANCNPNVLEFIFTEPEDVLYINPLFKKVYERRQEFLSKRVNYTYRGYAYAQLKRLKLHKEYLRNPVVTKPTREQFGLKSIPAVGEKELKAINAAIRNQLDKWNPELSNFEVAKRVEFEERINEMLTEVCSASIYLKKDQLWREAALNVGLSTNIIELLENEKKYEKAVNSWEKYQTWLKTRNAKRAELENKFGYDCKFGMHVVRLLNQGKGILDTGSLKVKMSKEEIEELLDIRRGVWTFEKLEEYVDNKVKEFDDSYANSKLPYSTDCNKLDLLCQDVICEFLHV